MSVRYGDPRRISTGNFAARICANLTSPDRRVQTSSSTDGGFFLNSARHCRNQLCVTERPWAFDPQDPAFDTAGGIHAPSRRSGIVGFTHHHGKGSGAAHPALVPLHCGNLWVGLLYFFNLVNVPFMKQVDAAAKPKIFQNLTLPALNWFRWSALVTVLVGLALWGQAYVGPDAQREGGSAGETIGLFLLVWIVAFWIVYFAIKSRNPVDTCWA